MKRRYYFPELEGFARGIKSLQPANLPESNPTSKLGAAQRKRAAKAAKRLARKEPA